MPLALFFGAFIVLLILGAPTYVVLMLSSFIYLIFHPEIGIATVMQRLFVSLDSFPFLAVPLFVFAGQLMNTGGITKRIFNFANSLVGRFRGGLGYVNVLSSFIFSGMSGSALADVGGLGKIEIKAMRDAGYDDDFTIGLTAASSTVGPIVPPSIPFIIYGAVTGVSVGALFMGGLIPGVVIALILCVVVSIISKKRGYQKEPKQSFKQFVACIGKGFFAVLMPLIIIGGIWSGYFTPTEAALVSIVYALLVIFVIYREMPIKELPGVLTETINTIAPSISVVIGASLFGWILQFEGVDKLLASVLFGITENKYIILLMINAIVLFMGMFLDSTSAIMLMTPILLPICTSLQINPIHLGVIIVLNLMIGLLTPPVGFSLYILSSVSGHSFEKVTKMIVPWLIPLIIALLIITFIPEIVLWIPVKMGIGS